MKALDQAIFLALDAVRKRDPSSEGPPLLLRQAYVNPTPLPPERDQDVLYYHLTPEPSSPLTEGPSCTGDRDISFFRFAPYRLLLVFYGPHAEALAWTYYHGMMLDGHGSPRQILRAHGMYPLPWTSGPVLLWEEWERQHRPRADLTLPLRVAAQAALSGENANEVKTPPEIHLHNAL